jgi:hypothetical protein
MNFFSLICIYCEKTFKNRMVLKEHMRKKFHKCINPNNQVYDKFYINNYLEPGTTWKQKQVLHISWNKSFLCFKRVILVFISTRLNRQKIRLREAIVKTKMKKHHGPIGMMNLLK